MRKILHSASIPSYRRTVLALLATATAAAALAQTRPALVRNVDEPGRNPYQSFVSFNASLASTDGRYFCQQSPDPPVCFVVFPAVPAGKRLVVENLTGWVAVQSPNFPCTVNIQTDSPTFGNLVSVPMILLPGDLGGGLFRYGANTTLSTYLEPGASPRVQVSVCTQPGSLKNGQLTLSGYTVDLP
jgi:hypothetical protein